MSNGGDMEPLHMVQDTAAAPRGCAALGKPSGILKIVALVLGIIGIILALVFATFAAIVPGFPWIVVIMIAPIASVFILLLLIIFRVRDVACGTARTQKVLEILALLVGIILFVANGAIAATYFWFTGLGSMVAALCMTSALIMTIDSGYTYCDQ